MALDIRTRAHLCQGISVLVALVAFFPATYGAMILGAGAGVAFRDRFIPTASDMTALVLGVVALEALALGIVAFILALVNRTLMLVLGVPRDTQPR